MQDLNICLVQSSLIWEDSNANLDNFSKMLTQVSSLTDLIILPEMFNTGFTMNAKACFEEMEGPSMLWMADLAKEKGSVLCGSMIIKEEGEYYNRFIWMRPDRSYEYYDKKHLFRMGDEHLHFSAGSRKAVIALKGWKVMPLICYDLRFPVWSKNRYAGGEYLFDLLLYVANWPAVRSEAWDSLLRARAIENMAYAAGVNRTGTDGRGYVYKGGSMVTAPDGSVICHGNDNTQALLQCTLHRAPLVDIRAKIGVGNDWDGFDIHQ